MADETTFKILDQIYIAYSESVRIDLKPIKLSPEPKGALNFTYSAKLLNGDPLSPDLITFDETSLTFTVESRTTLWIGSHTVVVFATGRTGLLLNQVLETSFSLSVTESRNKPYLSEELKAQSIPIDEAWEYKLPDALHKDKLDVQFEIDLSSCDEFVSFDG